MGWDKGIINPKFQALDDNGDPLSGGLVYTYESGTNTPKTTYSDRGLSAANANPVVLNSRGEASIYASGLIKIILKTSAGVTVWTMDDMRITQQAILADDDADTMIQVEESADEDKIRFDISGTEQIVLQDGALLPTTDNDVDFGDLTHQFKKGYIKTLYPDTIAESYGFADGVTQSLYPALGTDHTASGPIASLTAGEIFAIGELGYIKDDGKVWKSDADAATTMPGLVIALAVIAADAAGNFAFPGSFIRDDTWAWTVGGLIYASATAGALTQTAPSGASDVIQPIAIATHADRIFLLPEPLGITVGTTITLTVTNNGISFEVTDSSIAQAKLKSTTGEVSNAGNALVTLPGGEYGFYPQVKVGAGHEYAFHIGVGVTSTTYATVIYMTQTSGTGYAQQRYIQSSGEVFWIFVLRDKTTSNIISIWAAPDHPCFGNGGKPFLMPHPFLSQYNPVKHEIVCVNPTSQQLKTIYAAMNVEDETLPDKTFIDVFLESWDLYDIGKAEWPVEEITVKLKEGWHEAYLERRPHEIIKKIIPQPLNVNIAKIKKKAKGE